MKRDTRTVLLDVAQALAQTRGLDGFSFQDLAKAVGIRTASVHHHFPTKKDLGRELMLRYRTEFAGELHRIMQGEGDPRRRLERFTWLFRRTLRTGNRLCLCGMLATEFLKLPASVKEQVRAFYEETEAWLAQVLSDGRGAGAFRFPGAPENVAATFLSTLEGSMITARTFNDEKRLSRAAQWLIASLE